MDPSSLIFVVIVAIWAVYLLGHWVRRRDLLATARSVDRFSEAMRVLERRVPQPVAGPRSRSYVVAPSRLPEQAATACVDSSADFAADRAPHPAPSPAPGAGPAPAAPMPGRRVGADRPTGRPAPGRSGTARPAGRPSARPAGRPSARPDAAANRARALVLVALLVLVPVGWLLTAVTALPAWAPAVLTVALVGHVLRLRRAAMRRRELERRQGHARGGPAAGRTGRTHRPTRGAVPGSRRPAEVEHGRAQPSSGAAPARSRSMDDGTDHSRSTPATGSADPDHAGSVQPAHHAGASAGHRDAHAPAATASDETASAAQTPGDVTPTVTPVEPEADFAASPGDGAAIAAAVGSGWQPIPVPPPTYTLKPKAPAPVQRLAPAGDRDPARAAAASAEATEEAGASTDFDLDRILERRIAAGG